MTRVPLWSILTIALSAGIVVPAAAQTPLSLAEAIDTAIAGNPSLRAVGAAGTEARETARAARSDWFPRFEVSESWHRSTQPVAAFGTLLNAGRFTANDFAIDHLNSPGLVDGYTRRVGISQMLFSSRVRALTALAGSRAASADARFDAATADLALRVAGAYGQVLAASAAVDAASAGLDWAIEDHRRADSRRTAGTATDADVLAAAVQVAEMRVHGIEASGDLANARAVLNHLMAVPLDRAFTLSLPDTPSSASSLPSVDALTRDARANRAELREMTQAVAVADAERQLAQSAFRPELAASAGYEWNGRDFTNRQSAWTIGAELRWSLSLGGADAARLAAGRAGADSARAAREAAAAAIDLDVLTAHRRWLVALARLDVSRAVVDDAREAQRIVRQRYAAGMASMTDVLAAAAAWFNADAQNTTNRVGVITAWAALARATGQPMVPVSR